MNGNNLMRGVQIAGAIATMLGGVACGTDSSSNEADPTAASLTCIGGNSCKGMSQCAGGPGGTSCEGMNDCKGMGWSYAIDEDDCTSMGGELADASAQGDVKCIGGNSCMGMSLCEGGPGGTSCEGMNSCKGMGWTYTATEEDCTDAGGTVES